MRVIKRYRNRRLYDTQIKKVITRDEVKKYVLEGIELQIIENSNGRDITISVLSGIIGNSSLDIKKSGAKIMGAILKKGGVETMDIFKKLTLASIGAVNMTKEKLDEVFEEMVKKGEMTTDEKAEAIKHFVDRSTEVRTKIKDYAEEMAGKVAERVSSKVNDQIAQLAVKLEELNGKLTDLEKKINK